MKIAFRVDASLDMGTGHVMRCLTLADALVAKGAECHFICRAHPGSLLDVIKDKGHQIHCLPMGVVADNAASAEKVPTHAHWLGSDWRTDALQTQQVLQRLRPYTLVVDHYALDSRWEQQLRAVCNQLMVIDDLADRAHDCDLLLDQTHGREASAYQQWVPGHCKMLIGSKYALLRPGFAALREYSLERRKFAKLQHLLVTMGGVDKDNATAEVLAALKQCPLRAECKVTVVIGATAPWLASVQAQAATLPWDVSVKVNVSDMAQLMADSDLAIGAAGSTAWERAALGLPSLLLVTAENQRLVAESMDDAGAVVSIDAIKLTGTLNIAPAIMTLMENYADRVYINASICDGCGAGRVAENMIDGVKISRRILLREAVMDDCYLVYSWQKQSEVRKYARNPEIPSWENHKAWFAKKIKSDSSVFKIILFQGTPVGVVRLDPHELEQAYEVSVYLATEHSGHGIASHALSLLRLQYPSTDIVATVLPDNHASHALFRKSGYIKINESTYLNAVVREKEP